MFYLWSITYSFKKWILDPIEKKIIINTGLINEKTRKIRTKGSNEVNIEEINQVISEHSHLVNIEGNHLVNKEEGHLVKNEEGPQIKGNK